MHNNPDTSGKRMGMWLFLYTEIMLFSGLFVTYAAYYHRYNEDFINAGKSLNVVVGTTNTVLLLISSFSVAASVTAIRRASSRAAIGFLGVAIALGITFLINKYFEWHHKFEIGIYPNSPHLNALPNGETIFYGLYYTITGLHGLHVVIGVLLLTVVTAMTWRGKIGPGNDIVLENSGLYWHLVDLIWIFVFPLFYLVL